MTFKFKLDTALVTLQPHHTNGQGTNTSTSVLESWTDNKSYLRGEIASSMSQETPTRVSIMFPISPGSFNSPVGAISESRLPSEMRQVILPPARGGQKTENEIAPP